MRRLLHSGSDEEGFAHVGNSEGKVRVRLQNRLFQPVFVTYGVHCIHGRAPTIATAVKLAQPDLQVWVITGDGDALSIGDNHLLHDIRRNIDLNIILFNNRIYDQTKGQYSPTSLLDARTKSTPLGSIDNPLSPLYLDAWFGNHIRRSLGRYLRRSPTSPAPAGCVSSFTPRVILPRRTIHVVASMAGDTDASSSTSPLPLNYKSRNSTMRQHVTTDVLSVPTPFLLQDHYLRIFSATKNRENSTKTGAFCRVVPGSETFRSIPNRIRLQSRSIRSNKTR